MSDPEILTHSSPDALAAAVAGRLVVALAAAQTAGRVPSVVLTGGSIATRIHEAVLTTARGTRDVDWAEVDVWWGDERYVAADDDDRNAREARAVFVDGLGVSPRRVHEMPASDGPHDSLADAAAAYGAELRARAGEEFDVVMLGVGPDGHIASLFPGSDQLDVDDDLVVPVTSSPKPPPERISLTFTALNRAREVWFVVSGEGKAEAVAKALASDGTPDVHEIPAVGVRGRERTVWFLDEGSACRL